MTDVDAEGDAGSAAGVVAVNLNGSRVLQLAEKRLLSASQRKLTLISVSSEISNSKCWEAVSSEMCCVPPGSVTVRLSPLEMVIGSS